MSTAYYTFYFQPTTTPALSDEALHDLGHAAWVLLDKEMENWPERMVTVKDHDMDFQVEALELCEDDTGVEALPGRADAFAYGLGFYTEQHGLTLTKAHIEKAQAMCVACFKAAALTAGLGDIPVTLAKVDFRQEVQVWSGATCTDLEKLQAIENEFSWVTSNGDSPGAMYMNRDKAFAEGNAYVDAFAKDGKHLGGYQLVGFDEDRPATAADYTTDF